MTYVVYKTINPSDVSHGFIIVFFNFRLGCKECVKDGCFLLVRIIRLSIVFNWGYLFGGKIFFFHKRLQVSTNFWCQNFLQKMPVDLILLYNLVFFFRFHVLIHCVFDNRVSNDWKSLIFWLVCEFNFFFVLDA